MWSWPAQVLQECCIRAARIGKCVGKDREPGGVEFARGEQALVVGGLGKGSHETVVPGEQRRDERTPPHRRGAEDVSQQLGLGGALKRVEEGVEATKILVVVRLLAGGKGC